MAEPIRLTDLPFELDVALGVDAAASTLDITLTASADDELDEDSLLQSAEMVELLPHAANLQLLGALSGTRSSLQIAHKQVSADHRVWQYRLSALNVPQASWAILVALLVQTAHAGAPLGHVSLRSVPAAVTHGAPWLLEQAGRGVPRSRGEWPFRVEHGEPGRKQRRVTVEFTDEGDAGRGERFEEAVNLWDHLVTFGGFQLDFAEQEGFDPSMGSFEYPEPDVIEHLIWLDGNDDAAFDSLLHLLAMLHDDGTSIARVLIE